MAWTLEEWEANIAALPVLYRELFHRELLPAETTAFAAWVGWHMRENGHDLAWVRAQLLNSPEGRLHHDGPAPSPDVRVIRVTDERDGAFVHRMYGYWSNAWVSGRWAYVFAGHADGRPRCFKVDLESGDVERDTFQAPYLGTTEGWSWTADGQITLCEGSRLLTANPFTGGAIVQTDISVTHPGCDLWQAHASDDGRVHTATVRRTVSDGAYPKIGTIVVRDGQQTFYAAQGDLDESAADPSGRFVIIKEEFQRDKKRLDNRILDLQSGADNWIRDEDGAFGHSDMGDGCIVGEDDQIGACVLMDLRTRARRVLFSSWNMGHVSVRGNRCLGSDDTRLYDVRLDGSGRTALHAHGSGEITGANLDPSGRVGCYVANGVVYLLRL